MKILTGKRIIEFRGKSDNGKKNFASNLKIDNISIDSESGGDYWVSCLSAISNSFKTTDSKYIIHKITELKEKYVNAESTRIKTMYNRNIEVLLKYKDFDFKRWKLSNKMIFLKKRKEDAVLNIRGLRVKATPQFVYAIQRNDVEIIGAIWFIVKLDGYKIDELAIFTDILHRYLKIHFSQDYVLNPKYCLAVDVFNKVELSYSQVGKNKISSMLNSTLDEIKKLI
jgi:hypothetical protein